MDRWAWFVAVVFVSGCVLAALFDLFCLFSKTPIPTVTDTIRGSWLRYPMAVVICGFLLFHFIRH
jgi:hypothetical protein